MPAVHQKNRDENEFTAAKFRPLFFQSNSITEPAQLNLEEKAIRMQKFQIPIGSVLELTSVP